MKRIVIILLVLVIIGAIMFAANPTADNFKDFLERKDSRNIKKYASGSTSAMSDLYDEKNIPATEYVNSNFGRKDYYVVSVYKSKSSDAPDGTKYLGLFKIFIRFE